MNVEVLTAAWEEHYTGYLLGYDHASFNASLRFRDFFRALSPESIPYYFCAKDDGGRIIGVLPSFLIKGPIGPVLNSMPWFGSNPGIIADNQEVAMMLLQAFYNTAKWTSCFSSTFVDSPFSEWKGCMESVFDAQGTLSEKRTAMVTELPLFQHNEQFSDNLLKKFHRKIRNKIVKAASKCMIYEVCSEEDFDFAKKLHIRNTTAGLKYKDEEFDAIRSVLKSGEDYKLYMAFADDHYATKVAFLLVWYFHETVDCLIMEVDSEYKHLCPLPLLVFSAMGDAAQKGCRYWNWGRIEPDIHESAYLKAKRFGAKPFKYFHHVKLNGTLTSRVSAKWLSDNYRHYFVIPYGLLES